MSETPDQHGSAWSLLGADPGCCAGCVHAKVNATRRGTAYLRCLRAEWDDRLPRYPSIPVRACPGFQPDGQDG